MTPKDIRKKLRDSMNLYGLRGDINIESELYKYSSKYDKTLWIKIYAIRKVIHACMNR